jgi:UDP-N-acetylglucosamine 1-carboxyvinyltransferase
MGQLCVRGGRPLSGSVEIAGAKNAVLPLLAASLLSTGPVKLSNIPHLNDVTTMLSLLGQMGVNVTLLDEMTLSIHAKDLSVFLAPYDLVKTMRASILVLGPLLGRFGQAEVALPGGCAIGSRPVDVHIEGMRALGATVTVENGIIHASAPGRLQGARLNLGKITVTGTENLIMAAVLAEGRTTICQAACEPEVVDLANFLNKMGAQIIGAGTGQIEIEGVEALSGDLSYHVMPDRIEAGTYLLAGVMTRGKVTVSHVDPAVMSAVLDKIRLTGADVQIDGDTITVDMQGKRPQAVDISTAPYPGVPTDMQAQFMALNAVALGQSAVVENVFENRFMHVSELRRMGAQIELKGNTAHCVGRSELYAAPVVATDLRASAGLVLAALMAEGETVIDEIYHIDRGYERIEEKLSRLGAHITRLLTVSDHDLLGDLS